MPKTTSDDDATERSERVPSSAGTFAAAGAAASGAGAAAVATVATVCCAGPVVAPLVVGILGAGGAAWAAGLKPHAPWLLGVSALLLAYGFWTTYRPRTACAPSGSTAPRRWSRTASRTVLWAAAILWMAAAVVNLAVGMGP